MLSRTIRRSIQDASHALRSLPNRPACARLSTVSHTLEPGDVPEPLIQSGVYTPSEEKPKGPLRKDSSSTSPSESSSKQSSPSASLPSPTATAPSNPTTPLSDSVRELLPLLRAQKPHYIQAHIYARPYLLTAGDKLRLPFLMHGVEPGDTIRLNRAVTLGSRDFTLKAPAMQKGTRESPGNKFGYLDERLFTCRATVLGVESEPMRIKEKTKQRRRHVKHVKSKHRYTILRVSDVEVHSVEEVEGQVAESARRRNEA
ncbi:hypothetical protein K490DRAFT_40414 [Saccharata proteae CBS 121410]|uniref:Large ribosomal subunit protein bL21m n=1 Tax=Saccharata proteae CBS 121410 TaxID=1314787 RepID=A0A9P4HZS9_9PEZI|nr:hypothetical protein K490DRAFT_40414 [Saccharata proteae CBS 121410]